ncbi:MAG: hypothetical protein Q9209_004391 [Squamulea sp. 1 TL-2023]
MSANGLLLTSNLRSVMPLIQKGKVRDVYEVDNKTLLFVTTDRVSAFDVVLVNGIPNKGAILTLLTAHWAEVLTKAIPGLRTHVVSLKLPSQIEDKSQYEYRYRSMQCRKLLPFKIEAIVRGYLTREAWDSYQVDGTVCGIEMPEGLVESQIFPSGPIYTPSTKADAGEHDVDISEEQAAQIVGVRYADRIKELSLSIFEFAQIHAFERGLILVDTKFEFGLDTETDEVVLMDEILTPESSRFWRTKGYRIGHAAENLDKQFLRDWLVEHNLQGQNHVVIHPEVVSKTEEKYKETFAMLVGSSFEKFVDEHTRGIRKSIYT